MEPRLKFPSYRRAGSLSHEIMECTVLKSILCTGWQTVWLQLYSD